MAPSAKTEVKSLEGFPVRLALRHDLHLLRKLWHTSMGLFMVACYMGGMSRGTAVGLLGTAFVFFVAMEFLRLRVPRVNELAQKFWRPVMRSCEVNRVSGIPYYVGACLLSVAIFPKEIAILSILYLAVGDPMASLFGIVYGSKGPRFANGTKSLVGTAAGVLTCMAVTLIFTNFAAFPASSVAVLVIVGGLAGGLAELLPFELDDNFTIPVVSGFVLWLTYLFI